MKAVLALLLTGSAAFADPPGETPAAPPAATPPAAAPPAAAPPAAAPPGDTPPGNTPAAPPAAAPVQPTAKRLPPQIEQVEPPANARTEAWISTGVTAAIVGMGVLSVVEMREASNTANSYFGMPEHYNEWHAAVVDNDTWFHATLLFGGLSVASVAVTGILWSRSQPSFRVAPTPGGGYVGYARSF